MSSALKLPGESVMGLQLAMAEKVVRSLAVAGIIVVSVHVDAYAQRPVIQIQHGAMTKFLNGVPVTEVRPNGEVERYNQVTLGGCHIQWRTP